MPDLHLSVLDAKRRDVRQDIAEQLDRLIDGEVRFGRHDRLLYSTDASIYQVEPIGVVVPRSIDEAHRVVRFCAEHDLAILPRGGGTSLAGQAVNRAIVIDFSAYCNGIDDIDIHNRTATVEPGVVLAQLNQALQPHGLMFGPDVATATHANIGGMIGNNSAGARSVLYGRTVENLLSMDVLLADGSRRRFDLGASQRDSEVAAITRRVAEVIQPLADEIDARFPKTLRRCGGYNLDLLLAQLRASTPGTFDMVNLAHLLCGSEGTLAVTAGANLKLVDAPREKGLVIIAFADVDQALHCVAPVLETQPAAVELVDDVVIKLALQNNEYRHYVDLMPRLGNAAAGAVLYVEYFARDQDELTSKLDDLEQSMAGRPMRRYCDAAGTTQAWKLRAAGEPLLHGLPGQRKPLTFVEDAAVDPHRLCEFIREFRRIVEAQGTTAAYYAHASVGCLHVRPMIALRDARDREAMRTIAEQVSDLAQQMGGSNSAEHGDGRLRSHLLERFYGRDIVEGFRAIKAIFDPGNRLNPGNIVEPVPMLEHLRVRPGSEFLDVPPVKTHFSYEREGGFASAVEMCNGAGVCRKRNGGTMCPSYRGTLDERHATRGRGNALRLAITGQLSLKGGPAWNDAETLRTLDLCLSCKACKSECPSNVDIAKLKAEYLAQSYDAAGRIPLRARVFGNVRTLNRTGSASPRLSNASTRLSRPIINRLLGLDPRRTLPRFEPSLYRWFDSRQSPVSNDAPAVILFPDCFTVYNEPHIGRDAVAVLEALGYRVILPRLGCCGRSLISTGMLKQAKHVSINTAGLLRHAIEHCEAVAVVGCEPSCVSAINDDWPDLIADEAPDVHDLARLTTSIEDFVERELRSRDDPTPFEQRSEGCTVLLHGHCHQKALWGTQATESLLTRVVGHRLGLIDSGCCGMAGSFGYTADHYDLSMRIGEMSLMPAIREAPDATIVAPGTSCRHQIADATSRRAMHPIELAAQAIAPSGMGLTISRCRA